MINQAKAVSCPKGGWKAAIELAFASRGARTALTHRRHVGPLMVQRAFYPEDGVCHLYLLHPPGGVVGGDTLNIDVDVGAHASALLTTPAAGKFYRSAGATASQSQQLNVSDGGSLEWFPLENIYFPEARAKVSTSVSLQGDARVALWEIQCFGRPAIDEPFRGGSVETALDIRRDGVPLQVERLRISERLLQARSLMQGFPVIANFVVSHAGSYELQLARRSAKALSHGNAACTLLDDLIVVRYLGRSPEEARTMFTYVWQAVRKSTIGHSVCTPRIWST